MSLVKKFMTVGGATLGSRLFGFAREMLMAAALGTGPMADAFYAAFQFPNTFRRLFAEALAQRLLADLAAEDGGELLGSQQAGVEETLGIFDAAHFLPAFLRMLSTAFLICSLV